ncbi:UvrD-helicase domain-containing protein [Quisquiliibacterium transsilvanicum]|uniref:DNA 3'-5' helicase n=1 Tax=Quisquiliibacterium transsilvanicum TaxID=1549638 RepID=A0A7W8HF83_9BURK|nr:UvrD-helicase domain-containing protein [Quisquiliibacterium transsilvanicum]MBB5270742.1 DNA helicase-2/ATP-dependent DNA helicase PcrA [Quisquiliibacterium transsilvanicum]
MSTLLANLNEPQLAAVTLPAEHALILAGAGSGKTRVLTTRLAWLISTGQVGPQGVLAVTFTNKAAREMLTRLSAMLPVSTRGMWIGTFHGLCNRMLRAHHRDAGLPQSFQILDSQDQLAAIKRLLKTLNVDDERFPPRNLQHFINGAKEEGLRPAQVEAHDDYSRRCVELYQAYDDQCQREGVVDFAELLLRSHDLLERNQFIREHYQRRFRHILVDEFQDTNRLQYRWLGLLAGGGAAVFAVGDDDQSIYAFRGANVANMAAFEREYRVRNLIKLEQNYRSQGNILACANTLILNNRSRLGKNLWTDSGDGEPVRVHEALDDRQEAQWLVEEVRGLVRDGWARSDVAVLYRSNAQSRVIEHALFSAGLPYRVYGGLRFFERAEVKHALAYLRLIENPADDGAFLRVVNFPTRGIGARSLEALQDSARGGASSLFAAVAGLSGAAAAKLTAFTRLIDGLAAETRRLPLPELVEQVVERSGLAAHYLAEKEGQERLENLRELVNAAAAYLAEEGIGQDVPAAVGVAAAAAPLPANLLADVPEVLGDAAPEAGGAALPAMTPLAAFLSHASLEAGDNQAGEGADAVQLMTIHAAKGLEFDGVFVTGLEEGLFPHENAVTGTPRGGVRPGATDESGLEEERRLMYVAITRARQRLYLSFAQMRMLHGQTRYSMRSRFLDELPEGSLKWLTPRTQARAEPAWSEGYRGAWEGFDAPARGGARPAQGGAGASAWSSSTRGGAARGRADNGDTGRLGPHEQRAAQRFDRGIAYRVGQGVMHARFGEGVIVGIEGSGDDARVQVDFGRVGVKWLALSVAKLETLG